MAPDVLPTPTAVPFTGILRPGSGAIDRPAASEELTHDPPGRRAIGLNGVTSLDGIHQILAYAIVASTVAGIGWSVFLALTRRAEGPAFERFQAAVVSLLVVGGVSGLVLLATGARPSEGLHLLYAIVAIALIPLARSFLGRANDRAAAGLLFVAFVVLGAVVYRLFATG